MGGGFPLTLPPSGVRFWDPPPRILGPPPQFSDPPPVEYWDPPPRDLEVWGVILECAAPLNMEGVPLIGGGCFNGGGGFL